jgi:hypothetical protein
VHEHNRRLLAALRHGAEPLSPGAWWRAGRSTDWLVVDRASAGRRLPRRQGVGLARKIGCDLALALHRAGKLDSRWIHMTDADARLPRGYFEVAAPDDSAALAYPFTHGASGVHELDEAHALYEIHLRYYVIGLRWAGSPYAHHTIGSTLALDADRYAAVRGVPRRQAGEDFYLVNKLRKLGPIAVPDIAPIVLRARHSARVPFGTGHAVGRLVRGGEQRLYHPQAFALLRRWLALLEALDFDAVRDEPRLAAALETLAPREPLDRIVATAPPARRRARLHEWFDGFRTLKLLHALRDAGLASLPWQEALARAPFSRSVPSDNAFAALAALAAHDRAVMAETPPDEPQWR